MLFGSYRKHTSWPLLEFCSWSDGFFLANSVLVNNGYPKPNTAKQHEFRTTEIGSEQSVVVKCPMPIYQNWGTRVPSSFCSNSITYVWIFCVIYLFVFGFSAIFEKNLDFHWLTEMCSVKTNTYYWAYETHQKTKIIPKIEICLQCFLQTLFPRCISKIQFWKEFSSCIHKYLGCIHFWMISPQIFQVTPTLNLLHKTFIKHTRNLQIRLHINNFELTTEFLRAEVGTVITFNNITESSAIAES